MTNAFDARSFAQCLSDAEALVTHARDHEVRVGQLEAMLEPDGGVSLTGAGITASAVFSSQLAGGALSSSSSLLDLRTTVHQLTNAAQDQRELAETILARLVGPATRNDGQHRPRVLIVDDSENSRDTTATILDHAGFEVMTAMNGLEGVIVAHYMLPAVILMDVTMPILDGLEAARLIRMSPTTQHLKVVAYSAKLDVSDGPFARWFDDVLSKPSNPDLIIKSVRQFVGHAL
jgi:CheY-like chemotaxis protein